MFRNFLLFLATTLALSAATRRAATSVTPPATSSTASATPPSDTLTAGVFPPGPIVLKGATRDLTDLDIRLITIGHNQTFNLPQGDSADHLLIVREGNVVLDLDPPHRSLRSGGIALFPAFYARTIENLSRANTSFYLLAFKSHRLVNPDSYNQSSIFVADWSDLSMKKTDKGESRAIFNQPMAWLKNINMHATTLNPGEISHPQHMHRAEEILLLRSGNVRMHIANGYIPAKGGDLVFLPSGVPHDLENGPTGRTEYFALQWEP